MKRSLLFVSLIISLSWIAILVYQFIDLHPEKTGFKRKIRKQNMEIVATLKLPSTFFYFAGYSELKLFLKDLKTPESLFSVNYTIANLKRLRFNTSSLNAKPNHLNIGVQDTTIYLANKQTGNFKTIFIISGKSNEFKYTAINLDQIHLLSKRSIVGRQISLTDKQPARKLVKIDYTKNKTEHTYVLQKQTDGFFCTDGMLQIDAQNAKLYYMYFYRGEILCLDSNLRQNYSINTIDTISTAKLNNLTQTKTINKHKETTFNLASPPKIVNKNFTLYRNKVYVLSLIKSDNESVTVFKKNQVVDVYDADNGQYRYSFYIPKYKNKKLQEFRLKDNFIYAIFDNFLIKYKLTSN